jgi:hypothetical protein
MLQNIVWLRPQYSSPKEDQISIPITPELIAMLASAISIRNEKQQQWNVSKTTHVPRAAILGSITISHGDHISI